MKTVKWIDENFEEVIMVALLLLMTLIMGMQVFSRYVMKSSLTWSEELTRYMFIWCGFLSIAYCARKKLALRVDMLLNALPKVLGKVFAVIALLIEGALFVHLFPFAYRIMDLAVVTERLSPAMQIPMWMMQSAPFIGFGLAVIRIAERIVMEVAGVEVQGKSADEEVVEHYVHEAEVDLQAGWEEEDEKSLENRWSYRWTKRSSKCRPRKEDK